MVRNARLYILVYSFRGTKKKVFIICVCLICVPYMCTLYVYPFFCFFSLWWCKIYLCSSQAYLLASLLFLLASKQVSLRVTIYHESNLMTLVLLLSQLQLALFRLTLAVSNPLHQRQNIFTLIFTFLLIIKIKRWFFFLVFCHVLNFDIPKLNLIQIGIRNFEEKKVENEMNEKKFVIWKFKIKVWKNKSKSSNRIKVL